MNQQNNPIGNMEADDSGTTDDQLLMLLDDDGDGRKICDDEGSGGGSKSSVLPTPFYSQNQRVYAKDEATGLWRFDRRRRPLPSPGRQGSTSREARRHAGEGAAPVP